MMKMVASCAVQSLTLVKFSMEIDYSSGNTHDSLDTTAEVLDTISFIDLFTLSTFINK